LALGRKIGRSKLWIRNRKWRYPARADKRRREFLGIAGGAAASVPFAVREQLLTASRFPTELRQDLGYAIDRVGSADAALKAVADNELLTTSVFLA
jgi:hypothetical protein